MKKIILLSIIIAFTSNSFAQKSFRFGLKAVPALNWYKPDDEKKFENAGMKMRFGWGLMTEFSLGESAALSTGLEIDYHGGKLGFIDTASYAFSKDEIIPMKDTAKYSSAYDVYKLDEREYSVNYITIPLHLKMKTKEIGYMTYFGNFGLNLSFKTKARVNDKNSTYTTGNSSTNEDIDITKDMQLFRLQLNIGAGAEYNLSGSTSLVFGISYNYGFSNVLKKDSEFLVNTDGSATKQKAYCNSIGLLVGILF